MIRSARHFVVLALVLLVFTGCRASEVNTPETAAPDLGSSKEPFSIVVLPDTQYYTQLQPEIFDQQVQWILDNVAERKIAFVMHEGDITNRNWEWEWFIVHKIMSPLDGVVPYSVVCGNHDMGTRGSADSRETNGFNKFFGVDRFKDKPWYGGHMGDKNDNNYGYFTAGGMDFLVLSLEFGPRDETLAWANEVVSEHPDRRVIVVTHSYLSNDSTRTTAGTKWGLEKYKSIKGNNGDQMWDKFVKKHKNIFLVLCGHVHSPGTGRHIGIGDHGNTVHEVLGNYQKQKNFGNGWLRIMKFIPSENRIEVKTYSPLLNKYRLDKKGQRDPESMFDLKYIMAGEPVK